MYITYDEYKNMGGGIDETTFNILEIQCEFVVNWYTFSRLSKDTTYPEKVKQCMFLLIDLMHKQNKATSVDGSDTTSGTSSAIASQSNDGVSVSYNVLSASQATDILKKQMENTIQQCLQGVTNSLGHKLLYRGIYEDE